MFRECFVRAELPCCVKNSPLQQTHPLRARTSGATRAILRVREGRQAPSVIGLSDLSESLIGGRSAAPNDLYRMGVGIQIDSAGHEVPVSHGDVSLQGLPLRAIGSAPQKDNLLRTVNILRSNPGAVGNTITTALYTWYTFPTVGVLELI